MGIQDVEQSLGDLGEFIVNFQVDARGQQGKPSSSRSTCGSSHRLTSNCRREAILGCFSANSFPNCRRK